MTNTNSVYVAWQAPDTRDWHVVGNLQERKSGYVFRYTKGALKSSKFTKFSGMSDVRETYVSEELFPLLKIAFYHRDVQSIRVSLNGLDLKKIR